MTSFRPGSHVGQWSLRFHQAIALTSLFIALVSCSQGFQSKAGDSSAPVSSESPQLFVTPQDYGAIADGLSDDSDAVEAWLKSGKPLACLGTFKLTRVVRVTLAQSSGLYLQGFGRQLCQFVLAPSATVKGAFGGTVTINNPGSGYIKEDVLPVVGGTGDIATQIKVTDVNVAGGIVSAVVWNGGSYTSAPANPIASGPSHRGSPGTGATFTLAYGDQAAPAGIEVIAPDPDFFTTPQIVLKDFSIAPNKLIGNFPALFVRYVGTVGSTDPLVEISNVSIMPKTIADSSLICLSLYNVAVSNISDITCQGNRYYGPVPGTRGIHYEGGSISTTTAYFKSILFFGVDAGVYVTGTVVQGIFVNGLECVFCNRGVHVSPSDNEFLEMRINNMDANVFLDGALFENAPQSLIENSFVNLYQSAPYGGSQACVRSRQLSGATEFLNVNNILCQGFQSTEAETVGVVFENAYSLANTNASMVQSNQFSSLTNGVKATKSNTLLISGNQFVNTLIGINLVSDNASITIGANQHYNNTTAQIRVGAVGNANIYFAGDGTPLAPGDYSAP